MYDLTIPRRIVEKREALGLAAYELAKRAGISASYLSLIESGQKLPSEKVAVDLARALGEDPDLYRAWVETGGEPDLEARVDRLERMRSFRESGGGMRDWQRGRMARRRVELEDTSPPFLAREVLELRLPGPPEMLRVPLLDEGADPGPGASRAAASRETISIDPGLLDEGADPARLFAYRVSAKSIGNVSDAVSPGDVLVFAADPAGVDPAAIYAVRFRSRIVLSRIAYTKPTLFLMPGQPGQSPTAIPVDPRELRGALAGVVVAAIRTFTVPPPAEDEAAEPSLGRTGRLDEEGNLVRDCEWRENYGWRPVQRVDDMEYLISNPGKRIRFRLLRDGRARYVLELDAAQWQEALGEYYGGAGWYRNGYVVAITKKKDGEYTEEFQERWGKYVREAGKGDG